MVCVILLLGGCENPSETTRSKTLGGISTERALSAIASLEAVGESLFFASAFDSAEAVWHRTLLQSQAAGDTIGEGRVTTWLGLAARMRGDFVKARQLLEHGLVLKRLSFDSNGLGESYNALGLLAQDEDRLNDARTAFIEALRVGRDRKLVAKATGNLGLTLAYLGELSPARDLIGRMRDSARVLGEQRFEANALANLAMLDIWEGKAADALPVLALARVLYRALDYAPGEQNALGQLAVAYEGLGQYAASFAALDSSLRIARDKGMREDEAEILRLIAGLRGRLGDAPAALESYRDAAAAAKASGADGEYGSILRSVARIQLELGNLDVARERANEAVRLHQASGSRLDEVEDHLVLAEVEHRAGDGPAAQRSLVRARVLAARIGEGSQRTVSLTEARIGDARGQSRLVLGAVRALLAPEAPVSVSESAEASALAARAWARLGALDSAAASGARAIAALTRIRTALASEPQRRTLLADRSAVFADQVLVLLKLGRNEEAFVVADGARSRGLVESLASARVDLASRGTQRAWTEGDRLLREIDVLLQQLRSSGDIPHSERSGADDGANTRRLTRLAAARAEYEGLLARTVMEDPVLATVLGARPVTPSHVRAVLGKDEALLEYLVTPGGIVVFVLRPDTLHAVQLPVDLPATIERIRLLRDLWGHRSDDWQFAMPAARGVYRSLVGPVRDAGLLEGVKRLVLVPHGVLAQVPFAALRRDDADRWLVEDYDLLYVPSAVALPALRSNVVTRQRPSGSAFAPFPSELPATASEAAAFRRETRGVALVGRKASETRVRRALADEQLVHVATHGVLNAPNAMYSRIELARDTRSSSSAGDGRLEVHEVLGLAVRSPLVFLSGCETSAFDAWLNDPVRGTDHTTLAQALLYAGAGNVAGTLWRIDDDGAAAFAGAFYRLLHDRSPPDALAGAQRLLLANPKFANPYYWGSYLLNGSGILGTLAEK